MFLFSGFNDFQLNKQYRKNLPKVICLFQCFICKLKLETTLKEEQKREKVIKEEQTVIW